MIFDLQINILTSGVCAAISRSDVKGRQERRLGDLPGKRVFTSAATDEENIHGTDTSDLPTVDSIP